MENVLAILLAGGAGERLYPLTRDTAKPAVPFGGAYRIIDFTLSNCINSDVRRIFILTQYKALELTRHIRDGWNILSPELGEYIEVIPPMKRVREDWYQGTADAVFQNFQSIEAEGPERRPDPLRRPHLQDELPARCSSWHRAARARTSPSPRSRSRRRKLRASGSLEIDADYRIMGFEEKPKHGHPKPLASSTRPWSALPWGSTCSRRDVLLRALHEDAQDPNSSHDFGKDVIPAHPRRAPRGGLRFPRHERQAVALLARRRAPWTPTTKPTWTWWR